MIRYLHAVIQARSNITTPYSTLYMVEYRVGRSVSVELCGLYLESLHIFVDPGTRAVRRPVTMLTIHRSMPRK